MLELYDWRLSNPSEKEIRDYHFNYYLEKLEERKMLVNEISDKFNELNNKLSGLVNEVEFYRRNNILLREEINSIKINNENSWKVVKAVKYLIKLISDKKRYA